MNDRRSRAQLKLGERGERFAARFLKKQGYRILDANVRRTGGEIDLVALDEGVICFIEVKTRKSEAAGTPEEAVDARKSRHIVKAARTYAVEHKLDRFPLRFDIVSVRVGQGRKIEGSVVKGAFGENW